LDQFKDLQVNDRAAAEYTTKPATYEEQHFADHSLRIINEHDTSKPLFLFHSFHIVHTPLMVPDEWEAKFSFIDYEPRRKYAAMVAYMDDVVGRLVDAVKAKGMWDDTLIWFMSDNGGAIYNPGSANNWPLLGGKYSDFEGGVRVNAFVSGGWVPPARRGKVVDDLTHVSDVYATVLALAGLDKEDKAAAVAGLPPVDGVDQTAVLRGTAKAPARTEIHLSPDALVSGKFKLVKGDQPMDGWQGPTYPNATGEQPSYYPKGWQTGRCAAKGCLYNIFTDPTEHHDLADEMPELLANMQARLAELNKDNFTPNRGEPTLKACVAAIKNKMHYAHFLDPKDLHKAKPTDLSADELVLLAAHNLYDGIREVDNLAVREEAMSLLDF
jgi:arylsulfatase B